MGIQETNQDRGFLNSGGDIDTISPLVLNPPKDVTLEELNRVFPTITQEQATSLVKRQIGYFPDEAKPLSRLLSFIANINYAGGDELKIAVTRKALRGILPEDAPVNIAAITEFSK